MNPVILFRKSYDNLAEFEIASKYFKVFTNRTACKDSLVIGRYSCLPYYSELEHDLKLNNCRLVNTFDEHSWIADFGYYYELREFTAKSWNSDNFWNAPEGKFIVKGATNSKKHLWKTHMFAESKKQAIEIAHELRKDDLIGNQEIIYREYLPLKVLGIGEINEIPYVNEWRFFYYKKNMLSYGYYWISAGEEVIEKAQINKEGVEFANKVANEVAENVNFFVLDIAQKENGDWILIEVNDASMSGLSGNNPDLLYYNLRFFLENKP